MLIIAWLIWGACATYYARWAWRLEFRGSQPTIGTVTLFLLGTLLPPVSVIIGTVSLACWAFAGPRSHWAVPWPLWWGRVRYRQHRAWRWLWYLGNPPAKEHILSGWGNETRYGGKP